MGWHPKKTIDNLKPPNTGTSVQKPIQNFIPLALNTKDSSLIMWYICDQPKKVTIYDISYDKNGYPLFLTFINNQWVRKSAKYFVPCE